MPMGMGMMRGGGGGGRGRGGMGGMGGEFLINGRPMDMGAINEVVAMDSTEIWEIFNDSMMVHPLHIHHGQFQILDRDGVAPTAQEMGFKDTLKVGPGQTARFIMRFENFSDPDTAYMYHCHILEHEDNGMMGQFTVV
jgi:blue copper oxidase